MSMTDTKVNLDDVAKFMFMTNSLFVTKDNKYTVMIEQGRNIEMDREEIRVMVTHNKLQQAKALTIDTTQPYAKWIESLGSFKREVSSMEDKK